MESFYNLNLPLVNAITIVIGVVVTLLGYLVRIKGMLNVIAGYKGELVNDKERFKKWVGGTILSLGIFGVVFGLIGLINSNLIGLLFTIYTFVVLPLGLIVAVVAARRFTG